MSTEHSHSLRCADCKRELEIGDQYIEGTASEYLGQDVDGGLMADLLGGRDGKIIYCEDCTARWGYCNRGPS